MSNNSQKEFIEVTSEVKTHFEELKNFYQNVLDSVNPDKKNTISNDSLLMNLIQENLQNIEDAKEKQEEEEAEELEKEIEKLE